MTKKKSRDLAKYLLGLGAPFLITGIVEFAGCPEASKWVYVAIGTLYLLLAAYYWKR